MFVTRKPFGLLLAALLLFTSAPARVRLAAEEPSAGTGRLIIGTFPDKFWIIDEATRKVVGTIPYESGIPRRTTMTRDGTRFYTVEAQMEKVEVIDIASRKTIDKFTLSEGNKHVRIRSVAPDPQHRFVIMMIKAATKLIDRFEIGPPELVQYDLASHKVTRVIPWPKGEERENANIQFSPDGSLMYLFSDQDVLIYETVNFTQTDTWELSKPIEDGVGRTELRLDRFDERRAGVLHRNLHHPGSGAEPARHGDRPGQSRRENGRFLHARTGHARSGSP